MDRIRKALDLARQDRARVVGDDSGPIQAIYPKPAAAMPASIVYTKTRVFFPASDTLESNRIINPSDRGSAAAAFRMLRTQILQRLY